MNHKLSTFLVTLVLAAIIWVFPHSGTYSQVSVSPISVLDFSQQTSKVVTGHTEDRTIRIWSLAGDLLNTIQGPEPTQNFGNIFEISMP